ncbi:hypothetical protein BD413DRAFT_528092 [Trametes elegans]|nr:hypothetical protein BD413DRAFT_528092 [Trametes elegans]
MSDQLPEANTGSAGARPELVLPSSLIYPVATLKARYMTPWIYLALMNTLGYYPV